MPVRFHIRRNFCASLSVRVSDSGQNIKCARKYFTNTPCCDLHHYVQARYTFHHILLHNHIIIHTKTFLHQPVSCAIKYHTTQNFHILHFYTHTHFTHHFTPINTTTLTNHTNYIQKYIPLSRVVFLLFESETSQFK